MIKDYNQFADELARKITIKALSVHWTEQFLESPSAILIVDNAKALVKIEVHSHTGSTLAELLAALDDKNRMDWLEVDGNLKQLWHQSHINLKDWIENKWDVRQAIDQAMKEER